MKILRNKISGNTYEIIHFDTLYSQVGIEIIDKEFSFHKVPNLWLFFQEKSCEKPMFEVINDMCIDYLITTLEFKYFEIIEK